MPPARRAPRLARPRRLALTLTLTLTLTHTLTLTLTITLTHTLTLTLTLPLTRLAKWQWARGDAGAQALHLYPFGGLRNCLAKVSFGSGFG